MSTPTEATVHAAAIAAQEARENAANALFIAEADAAIADAVSMGKFKIYLSSVKHMSFKDIQDYYQALGYEIGMPNCSWGNCQPAQLFGQFWLAYWERRQICQCHRPCRVVIMWKFPFEDISI